MRLLLLSRPGCHLCEQMVVELLTQFPQLESALAEDDVDSREDWRRRYGLKIPVLLDTADGSAICVSRFDADAVVQWLADAERASRA